MKKYLFLFLLLPFLFSATVENVSGPTVEGVSNPQVEGVSATSSGPQYVSGSYTDGDGYVDPLTVAFTPQSGSNRCFIAWCAWDQTETFTSLQFDGNDMTEIGSTSTGVIAGTLRYYCTDSGTSEINVVCNITGSSEMSMWIIQVDNCDTADLIEDSDTDTSNNEVDTQVEMSVTTSETNTLLVSGAWTGGTNDIEVCNTTGQTLFGNNPNGNFTMEGGYFALSAATTKAQCFDAVNGSQYNVMIGVTGALNGQ